MSVPPRFWIALLCILTLMPTVATCPSSFARGDMPHCLLLVAAGAPPPPPWLRFVCLPNEAISTRRPRGMAGDAYHRSPVQANRLTEKTSQKYVTKTGELVERTGSRHLPHLREHGCLLLRHGGHQFSNLRALSIGPCYV